MRRFLCLLLIFALCVSLFTLPANAATPDGAFSLIKLLNSDLYTRSMSGDFRVVDDQLFQTMVLSCYNINFQTMFFDNVMPFSTAPVRLNDTSGQDFLTISFKTGSFNIDPAYGSTVVVGGINFSTGATLSYNNIFYSVFPAGLNYSANSPVNGAATVYYLPKDTMGALLVADLSNSSIFEALINELDGIASSLDGIESYSSSIASYIIRVYDKLTTMNTNISSTLSYVSKINTTCNSILSRLDTIADYEAVSADQLLLIHALLTEDMPTIIEDLDYAVDFLYSMDQKLYQISNKLSVIHTDLEKTNDYLEEITDHLNAEALKGYETDTGMNFFELMFNIVGNGFSVVTAFFSYVFMSISALLVPGLEGFEQITNIWSWNNSGYDPDYIVPDAGGG